MSKQTHVSEEQLAWLRDAVAKDLTRRSMARYIGVCEDTVRRILHRNGILEFDGAKFYSPPPTIMWNRPCTCCGSTTLRPKNQYRCDDCTVSSADSSPFDPDVL